MSKVKIVKDDLLLSKIFRIRNMNVMLDEDLARLYAVKTQRLTEQVRRNQARFPKDFMFKLTMAEWADFNRKYFRPGWGGRRKPPLAFTEHGVLMLSSVLNSHRAVTMNIRIMRVYVTLNRLMANTKGINKRLKLLEEKVDVHSVEIHGVFEHLRKLIVQKPIPRIGFRQQNESDES